MVRDALLPAPIFVKCVLENLATEKCALITSNMLQFGPSSVYNYTPMKWKPTLKEQFFDIVVETLAKFDPKEKDVIVSLKKSITGLAETLA